MAEKKRPDRPPDKPSEKREDPRKIERRTEPPPRTGIGTPGDDVPQQARVGPFQSEGGVDVLHHHRDLERSLGAVRFPAGKEDLLLHARGSRLSQDLLRLLEAIPEGEYDSLDSVEQAVRRAA